MGDVRLLMDCWMLIQIAVMSCHHCYPRVSVTPHCWSNSCFVSHKRVVALNGYSTVQTLNLLKAPPASKENTKFVTQ